MGEVLAGSIQVYFKASAVSSLGFDSSAMLRSQAAQM